MQKHLSKKLQLNRQTVATLTVAEAARAHGGKSGSGYRSCPGDCRLTDWISQALDDTRCFPTA